MIESIKIATCATFGKTPESLDNLANFNFIFGANATGKTTISRVIAEDAAFPMSSLNWKGGTKLQTLVYNSDFIEKNFSPSTKLKGVFTLGEKNRDIADKIANTKTEIDQLTRKIESLNSNLDGEDGTGGKNGEMRALDEELRTKCWAQKQKHDSKLQGAFIGLRNSAEKFKERVLKELLSNAATIQTLSSIEKRADRVFGPTPTVENPIAIIDMASILAHETNPILQKRIIGKDDVDIAAMIKKLGNSDWVRAGRSFYESNEMTCPFCQQATSRAFNESLNQYFDETFETDSRAIDDLISNYKRDSEQLLQQVGQIITTQSKFLDLEKLRSQELLLDSTIASNFRQLATKRKEPSLTIRLDPLNNLLTSIQAQLSAANSSITEHNVTVANLSAERSKLTAEVWKYLLDVELKIDLDLYKSKHSDLEKAISAMEAQVQSAATEKMTKTSVLRELEKQTTSIQPTIDGINRLLSSFGFRSFSLAQEGNTAYYKLVRPDGSDAKATLSEGEKNFVTFLYFYYLLKGSDSESGMTTDRVVVFDDPVSSLDSDILFIVGTLVKGLFDEVRTHTGHIKQVFVLTHNVYFHKEVTYNSKRPKSGKLNEETFWVVRKDGLASKIDGYNSNPIKTSYELLWSDIKREDPLTIQNTLRRILENYFKILGGVDLDQLCEKFSGNDKLICKSLLSWSHDGSHYAQDELFVSIDGSKIASYLRVFREIFNKNGQISHYMMMSGEEYVNSPAEQATI